MTVLFGFTYFFFIGQRKFCSLSCWFFFFQVCHVFTLFYSHIVFCASFFRTGLVALHAACHSCALAATVFSFDMLGVFEDDVILIKK